MPDGSSDGSCRRYFLRTGRLVRGFAPRGGWRPPVLLVFAAGVLLLQAAPAGAVAVPGRAGPALRSGTQLTMASPIAGTGQNVSGFSANDANGFQPITCTPAGSTNCTSNYPSGNPTPVGSAPAAWTAHNTIFAGLLRAHPVPNPDSVTLTLYCIDIHTATRAGINYELGSWEASGMPNVGYVARILNFYYPNVPSQPSGTGIDNNNQRAAAVQAAIWFFTDRFVLNTNQGSIRTATMSIVDTVLREGPLTTPAPPSLAITPTSASGHVDVLGPFRITSNHPPVTVTVTGGTMHSSATSTTALPSPDTVNSNDFERWLRPTAGNTTRIVTLQATSTAHVPSGNVYLFNETCTTPTCPSDAQRLILAAPATLTTTVRATGEFKPFGKLIVKKTIQGPAAHERGEVRIHVRCNDGVTRPDFVIPPGSSVREHTYHNIPAGTECTVTQTSGGAVVGTVVVDVTGGNGQEVTIPAGGEKTVHVTDTYRFVPGKLIVRKIIGGVAAGRQGQIVIRTECNGHFLTPDFVIPAAAAAGVHTISTPYTIEPTPATCTVTQTVDGRTTTVAPPVTVGSGQKVDIGHGQSKEAVITDDYGNAPGSLEVTKFITGPQAGQQGEIVIHTVCNGTPLVPDFVIPANTPGPVVTHTYTGIATPASCTVTETVNGSTSTILVSVTGSGATAHIPPGGSGAAEITDDVGLRPGELEVTKLITGPEAGHQGEIVIQAVCNGVHQVPDFVIPADTVGPIVTHVFANIPTPATCVVTEISDGSTSTISVDVSGSPTTVEVAPGGSGAAQITDDVGLAPGELEVNKLITGPEAGRQGEIVIQAVCNGIHQEPEFVIPAGTVGPVESHIFRNIPTPATCVVTETVDGHTSTVSVEVMGSPSTVEILPGGSGAATITDTYGATPGSLLVTKTIAGPLAGHQGPVTIHVVCDGLALSPDFVIPAHTHGTVSHSFDSIPAGSTCTVTETANGATATVIVQVLGNNQTVSIPAGAVTAVSLTNVYDDGSPDLEVPEAPGSPAVDATGILTVTKRITGPAARQHGLIAILVACGGTLENFTFIIPAHTGPGLFTHHFGEIPSGLRCTVRETATGGTSRASVAAAGTSHTVTIPAAGTVTVHITDRFTIRTAPAPRPTVTG